MKKINLCLLIIFISWGLVQPVSAHQPRLIINQTQIQVEDPEISKAYYAELKGEPQVYNIQSDQPFVLYVSLLVPDILNIDKDISAIIQKDGEQIILLEILDGEKFVWTSFYEPFGGDLYWQGPEYEKEVAPGKYSVIVYSADNQGKYSVAIGKVESFPVNEIIHTMKSLPILKTQFFEKSWWSIFNSLFIVGFLVLIAIIIVAVVLVILIIKKRKKQHVDKNKGMP